MPVEIYDKWIHIKFMHFRLTIETQLFIQSINTPEVH